MKRRSFLKKAGLALAAGTAAAAPGIASAQSPAVSWRMALSWPKSLDTLYGGVEFLAKRVSDATGGKFNIKIFAAGEIVGGLQVLDAVQNGTVECGHTANYYYFGKDPTFAFSASIPFGLNARQQNAWMRHGGGLELMREFFRDYNCYNIPGRQYRRADGRLVPQGDQDGRRPEGPEDAHRRNRRPGADQAGRGAAA